MNQKQIQRESHIISLMTNRLQPLKKTLKMASHLLQKPRDGWNKKHTHETRFRKRFTVNQAALEFFCLTDDVTSLDRLFVYFQEMESMHQHEDIASNYTRLCVYAAMKNNSDILHCRKILRQERI
jgi:hypothetical protein